MVFPVYGLHGENYTGIAFGDYLFVPSAAFSTALYSFFLQPRILASQRVSLMKGVVHTAIHFRLFSRVAL